MIEWWDDANQLVSWALLSDGVGAAWRDRFRPCTVITLVGRFGATTAVLWESAENLPFIRNSPELATAYSDTPSDLGLGLAESSLAALFAAIPLPPRRRGW